MKKILLKYPFFLFLLPLFFVLHGLTENAGLVPVSGAAMLLLFYLGVALGFLLFFYLFYRQFRKAAIVAFSLLAYQFFFGAVQDLFRDLFPGSFINKYSFIIPVSLLGFLGLLILLKKRKTIPDKPVLYLNLLFLLLISIDAVQLIMYSFRHQKSESVSNHLFQPCHGCPKPDIYLLLADGYPGKASVKDLLGYDNSGFEIQLKNRGFHIVDSSRSNYNFTAFSVASLLSMNYLPGLKGSNHDKKDLEICMDQMRSSPLLSYFEKEGYRFYNYSIFSFDGNPSYTTPTFLPQKTVPITAQTFTRRIVKDLWYHLATTFRMPSVIHRFKYADQINNEKLYALTEKVISKKSSTPKFVYTHLVMPHHPLYYDSAGNLYPISRLGDFHYHDTARRIGYLQYSNRKLLSLIDSIMKASANPPVIFLIGDHGIRELNKPIDDRYQFMTINAMLIPGSDYAGYYTGQSHVNQFRIFLNRQFKQQLRLLRDTSYLIRE